MSVNRDAGSSPASFNFLRIIMDNIWNKYPDTSPNYRAHALTIDKYGVMRVCYRRAGQWFITGYMPVGMSTKVDNIIAWMELPLEPTEENEMPKEVRFAHDNQDRFVE